MSTRAKIARPRGDSWEGVYHHFDGYPTGLGSTLWALALSPPAIASGSLDNMMRLLLDEHSAGWSNIQGVDWSAPIGFGSARGPACYCHGQRSEKPQPLATPETMDSDAWLFAEWVYVIDPERRTFSVICGMVPVDDGYGCRLLGTFPLDGEEPDWTGLELLGQRTRYPEEVPA